MSDNDIKIYSGSKIGNVSTGMINTYEEMNSHRANGNLQKARELGWHLATLSPTESAEVLYVDVCKELPQKFQSQDIKYRITVLLVFAAETLLQSKISSDILSTTAINAMHDKIRNDTPGFFRNIANSAEFTFYCLALKKGGDIAENIGEAFAMLCDVQKNKEGFINAGKTVWKMATEKIAEEIDKISFEK